MIRAVPPAGDGFFLCSPYCPLFCPAPGFTSQKKGEVIHVSKLLLIAERKNGNGEPVPFSFKAVTLKGDLIEGENCIATSSYNSGRTVNIKFPESGEFRKLRLISFIEFNGQEVFI